MILLIILLGLVALGSISVLKTTFSKRVLDLDPLEARDVLPETVSVIVPMRDEEENVDRCLTGLRAQACPQLETIVVDDCSKDGTADRLAWWKTVWPELQIVRLDADEERWAGKTYALHRGIQVASGASLLFVDADVALTPGAVSRIVTTAYERRWPVVSVVGRPESSTLWEKAIVGGLMAWFVFFRLMRPDSVLLGALIYIKRSLYESIGGYGNVRKAIQEDTALARALADYGVQPLTFWWPDAYGLRMYSTWRQAFQGLTRVFIGDFRLKRVAGTTAIIGVSSILPVLCIIFLLASWPLHDKRSIALLAFATLATCAQFAFYVRVLVGLGVSPAIALTKPFGDVVLFIAALNATAKAASGGKVTWRGRGYSKNSVVEKNAGVAILPANPGGNRLSLVLPVSGDSDRSAIEPFLEMSRRYPHVELVVVHDPRVEVRAAESANVKIIELADTTPFGFQRRGFLSSSGDIVAFVGLQGDYSQNWIQAVQKAFESQNSHIVVGNTQYEGDTALSHAGWMRDWAPLSGLNRPVPRISIANFAGRREILDHYQFGHDLHGNTGVLLLATQAGMDGVSVTYAPEMVCRLSNPYRQWKLAAQHLRAEHRLARDVYARGIAFMDFAPFGSRLFARFLPLTVSFAFATLMVKNYSRLCTGLGLSARERWRVLVCLNAIAVIDYHVALHDVILPPKEYRVRGAAKASSDWNDAIQRALFRVVVFYGREYNHDR